MIAHNTKELTTVKNINILSNDVWKQSTYSLKYNIIYFLLPVNPTN